MPRIPYAEVAKRYQEANESLDPKTRALLREYHNLSFDLGEWDRNESDEDYHEVMRRYYKAGTRLFSHLRRRAR